MIKTIEKKAEKAAITRSILQQLPEWFGIEDATKAYIENSQELPFFAKVVNKKAVGFIALKATSNHTAEIYCIGILKNYHRQGFGKELVLEAENYAKQNGYRFMQVKTVESGHYTLYDQTAAFYRSLGFYELEVFPTLWDKHNPCQVFIKAL